MYGLVNITPSKTIKQYFASSDDLYQQIMVNLKGTLSNISLQISIYKYEISNF